MSYTAKYIDRESIQTLLTAKPPLRTRLFATACRINCLYMIQKAGSGHIGTSFSSMDILSRLYLEEMTENDIFFSSKGHDAPAIYTVLIGLGKLDFDLIHQLRRLDGLPGHPDINTPHMVTNTGSLGMGIAKARGMAQAKRFDGKSGHIFVLMGDGELQEGQVYESMQPTSNGKFGEITAIIDHNKIQSDTWVANVSDLGDLETKFAAFGWEVTRCDGNDNLALAAALKDFQHDTDCPKIIIADTIKGKGISFMEQFDAETTNGQYNYHSGAISPEEYSNALNELEKDLATLCIEAGIEMPVFQTKEIDLNTPCHAPQCLMKAYATTLKELGGQHKNMVVLDADLALDCGLIPYRDAYPDRFIECGIAEMDMVSMAGGLALSGKLPVVHSFACFLTTRANEHIFNNATEQTKIIYAGTLAGLLPAAPGHSHQSIRDIALMGSVPGMICIQPGNETETRAALEWAINKNEGPTYIRLCILPTVCDYNLPADYELILGKGTTLRDGSEAVLFAYGPTMLQQACLASDRLKATGFSLKVVNMPWLNVADGEWLNEITAGTRAIFTLDDHLVQGGQGQFLASQLAGFGRNIPITNLGLTGIPACGQASEVLAHHGLDATGIMQTIQRTLAPEF